ncbi:MAG: methyltransferase domain-containing protein [Myxococcota bacterium]|nr:methyltransferase domain-containing protein [Myxococcota bacterium]
MKYRLLKWLACPVCRATDFSLETVKTATRSICSGHFEASESDVPGVNLERREEVEIMEGALMCSCGAVYPIRDGIPRMLPAGAPSGPATGHRWTGFDTAIPEWEENFRDFSSPLKPADFLGKLVMDAGCGFGRHAFFAARYGAEVIALDSSEDAVEAAARNTEGLQRVHVIQGDISRPPIRDSLCDLVYCYGVLHHVDEPEEILGSLTECLRPGGQLSLWVYGPRQGATLMVNNALRGVTTGLEHDELLKFSRAIARTLRIFSHTPYRWFGSVPVVGAVLSHLPVHDHHKWPFDVVVADVYDRLKIPVKHWFTREELEAWYSDHGFADVHVSRRVRNNETFRSIGARR